MRVVSRPAQRHRPPVQCNTRASKVDRRVVSRRACLPALWLSRRRRNSDRAGAIWFSIRWGAAAEFAAASDAQLAFDLTRSASRTRIAALNKLGR